MKMTIEQGMKEIMAIIGDGNDFDKIENVAGVGGAHNNSAIPTVSAISTVSTISTNPTVSTIPTIPTTSTSPTVPTCETIYDGRGHAVSINGKSTTTGYKKGARKISNPSSTLRKDLLEASQVLIERTVAFAGKTGWNSVEGLVIRLSDADYTIKCGGHAKREFADREPNFVATKNYITRGKAENHSPAIAKILVSEIENEFSNSIFKMKNENQVAVTLLSATASAIRFEIQNYETNSTLEFSFKITKKRTRIELS